MERSALGPWQTLLAGDLAQPWFEALERRVDAAYRAGPVFPPREKLFAAFAAAPPERVRVVILGQDPYHEPGQAMGMAFSVAEGVRLPPSLRNIFQERQSDLGLPPPASGDLTAWARQGVLLLNTVLTVEAGRANSHKDLGWQRLTDAVLAALTTLPQPMAFVLWGSQARKQAALCRSGAGPRLVLESAHPSPLSAYRGFFGSRPFSQVNDFLVEHGESAIDW